MKKLILVRHGETDMNRQGVMQGRIDSPLNEAGKQQAKVLAQVLRSEPLCEIWTSPLKRALATAKIISAPQQKQLKRCDELIERDFGVFEGRPFAELVQFEKDSNQPMLELTIPKAEPMVSLVERAENLAQQLRSHAFDTLLVVGHSGHFRPLLGSLLSLEFDDWFNLPLYNGCLSSLLINDAGEVVSYQLNEQIS